MNIFTIPAGPHGESAYPVRTNSEVRSSSHAASPAITSSPPESSKEFDLDVTGLFSACLVAITAVFSLLGVLALIMRLITALFPVREARTDSAVVAAISTAVASVWPGAKVTRIEEKS